MHRSSLAVALLSVLSGACSGEDSITDTRTVDVDKTPASWSDPGARPDPRPDAALPDAGAPDAELEAGEDAGGDACASQNPPRLLEASAVQGDACAFDLLDLPSDPELALLSVELDGEPVAAANFSLSGPGRLQLSGEPCDTLTLSDGGAHAISFRYGSCAISE